MRYLRMLSRTVNLRIASAPAAWVLLTLAAPFRSCNRAVGRSVAGLPPATAISFRQSAIPLSEESYA